VEWKWEKGGPRGMNGCVIASVMNILSSSWSSTASKEARGKAPGFGEHSGEVPICFSFKNSFTVNPPQ